MRPTGSPGRSRPSPADSRREPDPALYDSEEPTDQGVFFVAPSFDAFLDLIEVYADADRPIMRRRVAQEAHPIHTGESASPFSKRTQTLSPTSGRVTEPESEEGMQARAQFADALGMRCTITFTRFCDRGSSLSPTSPSYTP